MASLYRWISFATAGASRTFERRKPCTFNLSKLIYQRSWNCGCSKWLAAQRSRYLVCLPIYTLNAARTTGLYWTFLISPSCQASRTRSSTSGRWCPSERVPPSMRLTLRRIVISQASRRDIHTMTANPSFKRTCLWHAAKVKTLGLTMHSGQIYPSLASVLEEWGGATAACVGCAYRSTGRDQRP